MSTERDAGPHPQPGDERPSGGVVLALLAWALVVYGCYLAAYLR